MSCPNLVATRLCIGSIGDRAREIALHVLFICTGNICRSPTAERLAALYGKQLNLPDLTVSSAGTRAMIAHPIERHAAQVLETLGGDSSNFAARQLTPRIALTADLVLTMTKDHRDTVLELAPRLLRKTFTLKEAAQLSSTDSVNTVSELAEFRPRIQFANDLDVADPIGKSVDVFTKIGSEIAELLPPILRLCRNE